MEDIQVAARIRVWYLIRLFIECIERMMRSSHIKVVGYKNSFL